MNSREFVRWLYPAAKNVDVSPTFVVAQAALETGWGKSKIGNYNIFGITKGSWAGKTVLVSTTEVHKSNAVKYTAPEQLISIEKLPSGKFKYRVKRLFRDYDGLEECLQDHFEILKKPHFAHAWPFRGDASKFAEQLQAGRLKYATDPNYVKTLQSIIRTVEKIVLEEKL